MTAASPLTIIFDLAALTVTEDSIAPVVRLLSSPARLAAMGLRGDIHVEGVMDPSHTFVQQLRLVAEGNCLNAAEVGLRTVDTASEIVDALNAAGSEIITNAHASSVIVRLAAPAVIVN